MSCHSYRVELVMKPMKVDGRYHHWRCACGFGKPDLENVDERFRCPSNPCAVNVPQGSQSREFFEVFEAPRNLPCELLLWVND